jgi:hypothetical protein|tara:strand:- start:1028 stop:1180 length:153 start_codon:yes stop_codon:yes gene_type:complete
MANLNKFRAKLLSDRVKDLLKILEEVKVLLASIVSGMKQVGDILEDESRD